MNRKLRIGVSLILTFLLFFQWVPQTFASFISVDPPVLGFFNSIAYGDDRYVVVSQGTNKPYYSYDGETWEPSEATFYGRDVIYVNDQFVAVGLIGGSAAQGGFHTSDDGVTWEFIQLGENDGAVESVSYGNAGYVAVGGGGYTYQSADGSQGSWTTSQPHDNTLFGVAFANNQYVAVGTGGTIFTSDDGVDWKRRTSGTTNILYEVVYINNLFHVVGANGTYLTSSDGVTWYTQPLPSDVASVPLWGLGYGNGKYVMVGFFGTVLTSPNGIEWTKEDPGSANYLLLNVIYDEQRGRFIIVGYQNTIMIYTPTDSNPDSSINPTNAEFDKNVEYQSDIEVTMTLKGNTLTSISNDDSQLENVTDYTILEDSVTIKKEYLATQDVGTVTLTFEFSAGNPQYLVIEVSETPPPLSNNADLSNLILSRGTLSPTFNSEKLDYTVGVEYDINSVEVTPTVADAEASVVVNGTSISSGSAHSVPLNVGTNLITLVVTAPDQFTTKTYTVTVTRETEPVFLPSVTTGSATNITSSGAAIEGNVTSDGNATITERGVVYSTDPEPTITNGGKVTTEGTIGVFSVNLTELAAGTIYYYSAYAINSEGTGYGEVETFTTVPVYTVTFEVDGGSEVESQTVAHGETATEPEDPTKENYTFGGWYTSSSYEHKFTFTSAITADTILYAKWDPDPVTYTVTFEVNGGSEVESQTVAHGETATEPEDPTKENYTFEGWYTSSSYEHKFTFSSAITADIILYARWGDKLPVPQTYTVTYMGNKHTGGSAPVDHGTYEEGEMVTLLGNIGNLVRTGYTFEGWNTHANGSGTDYAAGDEFEIKGNVTLYAKWKPSSSGGDGGGGEKPEPSPNPNPGPTPGAPNPGPTPGTPSPRPSTPSTEVITVPVETGNVGSGSIVAQTPVTRTTDANGKITDSVVLTSDHMKETVQSIANTGQHTARIIIQDDNDAVSQTDVTIQQEALSELGSTNINLEIYTENVRIIVPYSSFNGFGDDIYFRVVPVKEEAERQEIEYRAKVEQIVREIAQNDYVQVVARPMTIETNLQSRPVTLILPLRDVELPTDEKEHDAFLADLVVYIEHSDGDKELVQGRVVDYKEGQLGIEFEVDKFSTFTIIQVEGWGEYVSEHFHQAYIQGYTDGSFKPQNTVTRAEIAAMLARLLMDESLKQTTYPSFPDVSKTHWAAGAIELVKQLGIMTGDERERFNPSTPITRAEMAMIVARYKGIGEHMELQPSFSDVTASHWAASAIEAASQAGIVKGYENGTYRPSEYVTRAEAVVMLNRLFGRSPLNVTISSFPDVLTTHWAFKEIEEAAKDHFHLED